MEKNNKNVDKEKFWTTNYLDKAIEDFRKIDAIREKKEKEQQERLIKILKLLNFFVKKSKK